MTTEELSREALPFDPDFARRVLDEAGRIAVRRRRLMRAGVVAAAVAVAGTFGLWSVVGSRTPKTVAPAIVAMGTDAEPLTLAQSAQTEPLDYMFPEATPLAAFADQYSGAVVGGAAARRNMLFGGEDAE